MTYNLYKPYYLGGVPDHSLFKKLMNFKRFNKL